MRRAEDHELIHSLYEDLREARAHIRRLEEEVSRLQAQVGLKVALGSKRVDRRQRDTNGNLL